MRRQPGQALNARENEAREPDDWVVILVVGNHLGIWHLNAGSLNVVPRLTRLVIGHGYVPPERAARAVVRILRYGAGDYDHPQGCPLNLLETRTDFMSAHLREKAGGAAVELAMQNSIFAVCAEVVSQIVGCGRVIGDGGLHLYLTDIIVHPDYQRRGIGSLIVTQLMTYVESTPYQNLLIAVLPTPGLAGFYAKHGFKALASDSPAMQRWFNAG
jgi:GNAT superfamily N-acetyltransferase